MIAETLSDMTRYIDFLRESGYSVQLSCFGKNFDSSLCLPTLLAYEVHSPAICAYLKTNEKLHGACFYNKELLKQKEMTEPYYSCCHAGVEEYIFPVRTGGETIMCIHFSGYRGKLVRSERKRQLVSRRCDARFDTLYEQLSDDVPTMEFLAAAEKPLEYIILRLLDECRAEKARQNDSPTAKIFLSAVTFIYENYTSDIRCADIARAVRYSESYLRRIFIDECGTAPARYITEVRLSKARELLEKTSISVTDIATGCGFGDANYFSSVFSKKYGMPPRIYRKNFHLR